MPDFDREKFAYAVAAKLSGAGVSGPRPAARAFPGISPATWSRIGFGHPLSAANVLAVCRAVELDPFEFLVMDKAETRVAA